MSNVKRIAFLLVLLTGHASTLAQTFHNLDLEQGCDTCASGLAHWGISWQAKDVTCTADGPASDRALLIASTNPNGVGFVEQAAAIGDTTRLRIVSVSASIRSEEVKNGRGAGIYLSGYDDAGRMVFSKDMGFGSFRWILGTHDEQRYGLKAVCPSGVATLKLGFILYGSGRVWINDVQVATTGIEERKPGPAATAYVSAACDTIRLHALYRDSIDLTTLRATALRIAGDANEPTDHHLAVDYLLQGLGDHHSFFMDPATKRLWEGEDTTPVVIEHATHRVIQDYGYILVPPFQSNAMPLMHAYADTIQQAIAALAEQGVKGWIIDLRMNTGGNMAPMVCGLGPLLDPGVLGRLVDVDGRAEQWFYTNGSYGWDEEEEMHAPRPVTLEHRSPIAVLISQLTGSSGECVTISFIGNARTRLFGQPTWGLTTGNGNFDLPDGARMFLASTTMADRNGRLFHGPIEPDERVEQPTDWSYDAALDAALQWLGQQR